LNPVLFQIIIFSFTFKQIRPCLLTLLHNVVGVSNGVVHHGDDRQPFQNGPSMHLPYAPAAWRVLSDSTGKWTISLILISQNGQNCWAAHLAFVFPPHLPLSCPSFSTVFRSFIRTACFRNLRDVYRAHPTERRDSCGFQPPSASGSTARLTLVTTAEIRHRYFSKKSNLYQLNLNSSWDFISIDEADIRYMKFCLIKQNKKAKSLV
jgi:hypothetical protein